MYSSAGVVIFSLFMIGHYIFFDVSVPLTAVYYGYVAIWPTLGMFLILRQFILKKMYRETYSTVLFIGYLVIMISLVVQLVPTISDLGMGPNFLIFQTFPMVAVILILSFLSSSRFNREYEELIELKTSLEIKVEKRTKALMEADRQKTDYFINFAHEMKTPLLLIQNYLERHIERNGDSADLNTVKENLDILTRNMINVLDFEKLEKRLPLYDHQKVSDVTRILEHKMTIYELPVKQAGLSAELEAQPDCFVQIDPIALDRIFNNLLDNAIRYNSEGGSISVKLESADNKVVLAVANTGTGIPEAEMEEIFKPYHQIARKKRNIQGIGVGLNIVKQIIDDVGGSIKVESSEDGLTRFILVFEKNIDINAEGIFEISVPTISLNGIIEPVQTAYCGNRKTLFIIEDNIRHLAFLQSSLEDEYNIFFAVNGREALNKLPGIPVPDLFLCDIMMDELDGFGFFEELSGIEKFSGIPFIFISALTGEEEKLRGLDFGAIDFISKPYPVNELKSKIKSIIRLDETREQQQLSRIEKKIAGALHEETAEESLDRKVRENCEEYKLSPRETEVVLLILKGLEHKEIGFQLDMALNTLKTHIRNIYSKCKVQNKIELVNKIRR